MLFCIVLLSQRSVPQYLLYDFLFCTGCEFGNRNSWCESIYPGSCYEASYQRECCLTCPQIVDLSAPSKFVLYFTYFTFKSTLGL